ncbi:MAG: GYD domain-containing protein, partial [Jatrophihabitantaceae bacterium]
EGGGAMTKFAIFFTFTGATVKRLIDHPSDRAAAVAATCESAGGRLVAYYLMFGAWDGFIIIEVPDSRSAAAVSLAVSSTGALDRLETHELVEPDDLAGILAQAGSLTYSPPGA